MIHAVTTSGPFEEILGWLPTLPVYVPDPLKQALSLGMIQREHCSLE